MSRLVLQPNTQVRYIGFQNGKPSWEVIMGTINGRYHHPSYPDRSLSLQLNQSVVTVTQASFQAKNEITDKSVTAYDQPLHLSMASTAEVDQTTIVVDPGETYVLLASDPTSSAYAQTELETTETATTLTATASTTTTSDQIDSTQTQMSIFPESLNELVIQPATSSINLTMSTAQPLTFIWTESDPTIANQKYRIFRSESTPLDEKTAHGYRTTAGTRYVSYVWPVPSINTTYHFRVCRLKNNQCEIWSNAITIPAGTLNR